MHLPELFVTLPDGYSRLKDPPRHTYRMPEDISELIEHLSRLRTANKPLYFLANDGTAKRCYLHGRVQRDSRANTLKVTIRFGAFEYYTLTERDITRVLIPTEQE